MPLVKVKNTSICASIISGWETENTYDRCTEYVDHGDKREQERKMSNLEEPILTVAPWRLDYCIMTIRTKLKIQAFLEKAYF